MPKDKRSIAACMSDFHCGHSLGLLNPDTMIEHEGKDPKYFSLGGMQKYLWKQYRKRLDQLEELADGSLVNLFFNGDIMHGTKYLEAVFAVSLHEQVQVARWCIKEALDRPRLNVKSVRFLLGTSAHTLDGSAEQLLCDLLRALYGNINFGICGHSLYTIGAGGADFDVAHHGPGVGTREWTKVNVARAYALSLMMRRIEKGERPPNVVLRSHRHRKLWETVHYGKWTTEMIVTPSFCGMNGHGLQMTQSLDEQDHGLYAFEVEGKQVRVIPMVKTIDLRVKETLDG